MTVRRDASIRASQPATAASHGASAPLRRRIAHSAGPRSSVVLLLLGVVLLSGCGPAAAVADNAYDRAVGYFDHWAAQRDAEDPPRPVADGMHDYVPEAPTAAAPRPVRVALPSVGVSTTLERLGLAADGAIETPDDWQRAGWYRGGPRPGELGAAVILGHVDSTTGPAVFYDLQRLRPGDRIRVTRDDGSVAVFAVDRVEQHRKTRFPTDEVYFPTPEPTLRLVTCGGAFDTEQRSYRDNVVVFASLETIRT